jgi:hypothetical protein
MSIKEVLEISSLGWKPTHTLTFTWYIMYFNPQMWMKLTRLPKKTLTCIFQPNPQNPVPGFRKHIESALGVKKHNRDTKL